MNLIEQIYNEIDINNLIALNDKESSTNLGTVLNDCLSAIRNYEAQITDKVIKLANSKASKTQIDWAKKLRDKCVEILPLADDKASVYDIYKRCLLYLAPYDFDSYMQYMEIDREPSERFYLPRRKILKRLVDALQELADDELDELFISQPPRTGKALANDTPVLTRNGWKNHGDLVVGDEVIGMNGEFKKVIAVHPKCMLDVLVEFGNGEKIQCHENHEWRFYDRNAQREMLLETKEWEKRKLESNVEKGKRGHRYVLQLPKKEYVKGEYKDLGIDPYTFGVWLGDGANQNPRICGDKRDCAIIEKIPYPVRWQTEHKTTGVMYYDFDIRKRLQKYGLCHSRKRVEKYIPEEFLTASIEQRLELLAGLIDTDGSLTRKEHRYHFTTSEEKLKDTFVELVSTFGWRCSAIKYDAKESTSGIKARKPHYVIGFNPDCYIPCALERKQLHEFSKYRAIPVTSITRVEPKEGNCITVEGDGMYLCGRTMIPTHNTTLLMFFVTWIIGREPERSNLYSAFSDIITSAFYSGIIEVLRDPYTYKWGDVFPESTVVTTNAKDETLNIDRNKRYPSITCRSLYGTLNGACDCNGFLISDDLIGGIEEALNKDRMISAWSKVDNNLLARAKSKAKILWNGTRWSIIDPAGIRMELLTNDNAYKNRRYKVINLPALDENDESNFDYDYGVGFDTEYYRQRRASFERNNDMASWFAQYMGEPIERDGALFTPDEMRYYNGEMPDSEPDRIFMAVDPAFGGGDFVAAPVCYQYGDDIFVVDVVYNDADKTHTQKELADKIEKWDIKAVRVEANKSTESYATELGQMLKNRGIRINLTTKPAPTNVSKNQRIFDKAPDIREQFIFLESGKRSKEYELFMQNVFSFKIMVKGNKQHDDAPDSLSMAVEMILRNDRVEIFKRPW